MTLLFLERLRLSTTEASTRPCNGSMTAVSPLQREVPLQRSRVSILRLLRSLTSDCVMAHYNPEAEAELKVDASQVGLGYPDAIHSRTLADVDGRYSQTKRSSGCGVRCVKVPFIPL